MDIARTLFYISMTVVAVLAAIHAYRLLQAPAQAAQPTATDRPSTDSDLVFLVKLILVDRLAQHEPVAARRAAETLLKAPDTALLRNPEYLEHLARTYRELELNEKMARAEAEGVAPVEGTGHQPPTAVRSRGGFMPAGLAPVAGETE